LLIGRIIYLKCYCDDCTDFCHMSWDNNTIYNNKNTIWMICGLLINVFFFFVTKRRPRFKTEINIICCALLKSNLDDILHATLPKENFLPIKIYLKYISMIWRMYKSTVTWQYVSLITLIYAVNVMYMTDI
jgi:hypothetical protein